MEDQTHLKHALTEWFKQGDMNPEVVLPQKLSDDLLEKLVATEFSLVVGNDIQKDLASPVMMCVGFFLSPDGKPFEASKEMLLAFGRSYHFNVLMEQLRRSSLISIEFLPTVEDIFDLSKERNFMLTEVGQKVVGGAGDSLSESMKRGLSVLAGGSSDLKH